MAKQRWYTEKYPDKGKKASRVLVEERCSSCSRGTRVELLNNETDLFICNSPGEHSGHVLDTYHDCNDYEYSQYYYPEIEPEEVVEPEEGNV